MLCLKIRYNDKNYYQLFEDWLYEKEKYIPGVIEFWEDNIAVKNSYGVDIKINLEHVDFVFFEKFKKELNRFFSDYSSYFEISYGEE